MEGYENKFQQRIPAENQGREPGLRQGIPELGLVRRPQWGGGALRAFRLAEIVVDEVLFGSSVGGVAVAMTVASIFHFEFWFLWGVVLNAFLVAFWRPLWILRASLGVFWESFGVLWVTFWALWTSFWLLLGPLGVLWGSQGSPGTSLGASGAISGIFREIPGGLLAPF